MPLDSFAELDAVGRLRLLMRQSTEETLAADVDALLLPALQQLPAAERTEALQRCTSHAICRVISTGSDHNIVCRSNNA